MSRYAPLVIFCYRRKIDGLINSLLKNQEAKDTELFIFSDGFKTKADKKDVVNLRRNLKKIRGFKSLHIIESDKNKSLSLYQNKTDIWSVSGYSPAIPQLIDYKKEVYLSLRSSSWGWATWADRWKKVDWSISDFKVLKKNKEKIMFFEQGGNDLFKMLELQYLGKIDSWAVRWCYSQFLNSSYSVTPKISMTHNNGFSDGYGVHNSGKSDRWHVKIADTNVNDFETSFDAKIIHYFKKHYDINLYTKIGYFLRKWGGYNFIKYLLKIF